MLKYLLVVWKAFEINFDKFLCRIIELIWKMKE